MKPKQFYISYGSGKCVIHWMRNEFVLGAIILVVLGSWMILNPKKVDLIDEVGVENLKVATFAGGCFWCIEASLEAREGVVEAISGYTGGTVENPTYAQVTARAQQVSPRKRHSFSFNNHEYCAHTLF